MNAQIAQFLASTENGVFFPGHASALCRLNGDLVLFDPIWDAEPYRNFFFWPAQVNCDEALPKLDACIVSHKHADHWTPEILSKLTIPVSIMGGRPGIKDALSPHACVIEYPPLKWEPLTRKVEILFCPHPYNPVDSFVVLRSEGVAYALGSDCFLDQERLGQIKPLIGDVDILATPWVFVHFHPFLQAGIFDEFRQKEINRLVQDHHRKALLMCEALRPKHAVTTGDGLYFKGGRDHILNRHLFLEAPLPLRKILPGDILYTTGEFHPARQTEKFPEHEQAPLEFYTKDVPPLNRDLSRPPNGWAVFINETVLGSPNSEHYYRFEVDRPYYEAWVTGAMSFEEVLGSRRFWFSRYPNKYDPQLMAYLGGI